MTIRQLAKTQMKYWEELVDNLNIIYGKINETYPHLIKKPFKVDSTKIRLRSDYKGYSIQIGKTYIDSKSNSIECFGLVNKTTGSTGFVTMSVPGDALTAAETAYRIANAIKNGEEVDMRIPGFLEEDYGE